MTLRPPETTCDACHLPLAARKTRAKPVHFPTTTVRVREVQRVCPRCKRVWGCPEYAALTPPRANTSWGLVAWIGKRTHHDHRQLGEIQEELVERGIVVGASTIRRAAHAFLERFVALHDDASLWGDLLKGPLLWKTDATTEAGGGSVLVVQCQEYTVAADGIPSESAPNVEPVLRVALDRTGAPVAVGRDYSKGIQEALTGVVPGAVQVGCHYHFGRDAGVDAMGDDHVDLAKALNADHVRSRLNALMRQGEGEWEARVATACAWILETRGGLAFPFRRPALELVQRLDAACAWAEAALVEGAAANEARPPVAALKALVQRYQLMGDASTPLARRIRRAVGRLQRVAPWFDQIRDALTAFRDGPQDAASATGVAVAVARVEQEARALGGTEGTLGLGLATAVRKRWDELVAPVLVDGKPIRVDRTISGTEQSHRVWKRGVRRRTGQSSVRPALHHDGPALAYLDNWNQRPFQDAFGGTAGLIQSLARVDPARLAQARLVVARLRLAPGRRTWAKQDPVVVKALNQAMAGISLRQEVTVPNR